MVNVGNSEVTWKWHHFLVNFALYASAVLNGISALYLLYAVIFANGTGLVIPIVGAVLTSICSLGAQSELKEYKKEGISSLMVVYGVNIAVAVILMLRGDLSYLASAAVSALMIWLNRIYYNKREEHFN